MEPNYKGNLYRKRFYYNGIRYQVTATSEDDMLRKYYAKEQALKDGDIVVNSNTKVNKWAEQWLEVYKKPKVKESVYINIKAMVDNHIVSEIGYLKMGDVKRVNLQKLLNNHASKSYSHLSKLRVYLMDMFAEAEEDEIIVKSPARKLTLPEYEKGEVRAMTEIEYSAALEVCKTHRAGLWIMLMLRCGLRRGETVPLVWSDIDFKNKTLNINKSVEYVKGVAKLNKTTKTMSGMRKIIIPNDVFKMLEEAKKNITGMLIFTPKQSENMLSKTQVTRLWNSFKRELDIAMGAELYRNKIVVSKIEGLHLHCLRHTAITKLVESGANIKDVQYFAGHSDMRTTLNIYTHIDKNKAQSRIANIQNGTTGNNNGKGYQQG